MTNPDDPKTLRIGTRGSPLALAQANETRALIEAAPDRIMWGSDWPHPNKYVANPNDGDLVNAFGDWVGDENMRRKIMVDTPAAFYRF